MAPEIDNLKQLCIKAVEHFKKELTRLRSGRASAALLDGIHVDYYGSSVPLIQLGMVNAPEPRMLTVQVYDSAAVESVEKAISKAELGLNPSREGTLIRINIPALNDERRKELIKKVHKMAEEVRVGLRNHRRDALESFKKRTKNKEISEDEARRGQDEVQKVLDKYIADVDAVANAKEKELVEV
jgi:ribosome recycling factor